MSFISLFEIIRPAVPEPSIFFWIPTSIAEAAAVISNGAKIVLFAKGTATFIDGPANLLSNKPKNPPDWIILDIYVLDRFISVDILFSNTFLNFVFCLVVNNNSCVKWFPLNILIFVLKLSPVYF